MGRKDYFIRSEHFQVGHLKMGAAYVGKSEEGVGDIIALGQVTHKNNGCTVCKECRSMDPELMA